MDEFFGENASQKLITTFDQLSGASQHADEYERLEKDIGQKEALMKATSDNLKELRHERVKLKGLTEFQKQIDACVDQQKELESVLVALSLLQAIGHCSDID